MNDTLERRLIGGMLRTRMMILGLVLATLPSVALGKVRSVDETRDVSPTGTVEISTVSGTVTVSGWDKGQVSVKGSLDEDITLEFTSSGNRTVVRVKYPESHFFGIHHDRVCDLQVKVPAGSELVATTVSADLEVSDVKGDLELETVSGALNARGTQGEVKAKSVSGEVKVLGASSRIHLESVSGGVSLQGPGGDGEVSSVSGDVEIDGGSYRKLEVSTVSGNLVFSGEFASGARCDLSSHSGSVELRLKDSVSAAFHVETFSGEITNELGGESHRKSKYAPGEEADFSVGSGDAQVEVSSFSGSVTIAKAGGK